jgi:E3 SUMO-protein ligase PIAS1
MMTDPLLHDLPPNRADLLPRCEVKLQKLVIAELKSVCRQEGLTVSGKKADLVSRISRRFREYLNNAPINESFDLLWLRIHRPSEQVNYHHLFSTPSLPAYNNSHSAHSLQSSFNMPRSSSSPIKFVESPFFRRKAIITSYKLPACSNNRHEVGGALSLTSAQLEELRANSSLRVFVYCGEASSPSLQGSHIKFPPQLEIRVNEQEVKANFKGVGKKEGSIKPVDITPFLRKQHFSSPNTFKFTYALSTKVCHSVFSISKCKGKCNVSAQVVFFWLSLSFLAPHD